MTLIVILRLISQTGYIQTAAQRPVRRLLDAPRRPARLSRGHGRRICDRDLARAALPRGLVRRSHGHLSSSPANRHLQTCWSIWRSSSGSTTSATRRGRPHPARQLRHQRPSRLAATGSFTEAHILAITQAICDYRRRRGITARSTWARTRTRCPARPSARRSRSWPPTAWRR